MVDAAIAEILKGPPEAVRLAELYPELPQPIPFADAIAETVWDDEKDAEYDADDPPAHPPCYEICVSVPYAHGFRCTDFAVTAFHHRIVGEYNAAQARQHEAEEASAAVRRKMPPAPPSRAPQPEEVPPGGTLTPRQEDFCRHYAAQPVATRAAILAGYSEDNAAPYGSRLLNNPLILDRIATLRAEQRIHYVVERDTVHDKLEAVFFGALGERHHSAAVAALRLQAALAGMMGRAAAKRRAKESQRAADEKPRKAKVARRAKPRKSKARSRRKPRKANQSQ